MLSWLIRSKIPLQPATAPDIGLPEGGWLLPETAEILLSTPLRQQLIQLLWQRTSLSKPLFAQFYLAPLRQFAALVQRLPASESHHHAHLGGMLDHALEVACFAAKMRQAHLLPPGCPPEDQAKEAEAWTAAIVYAALLHDVGKLLVDMTVITESGAAWHPWQGPLSQPYRFHYQQQRDYRLHPAAGAILCTQILPASVLSWLSQYPQLFSALLYCASGHYEQAGIMGELVQKADRASVAQNLGGDATKALARPQSTLPKQIITALRALVQETFKLNNPRSGSDGWLTEQALWLVSKTAADGIRSWLLQQGITGVPDSNSRLFDEMQAHRIAESNEGKAIWHCRVESSSGWSPNVELTLLRIPPALVWQQIEHRPPLFAGTVMPVATAVPASPLEASPTNDSEQPPAGESLGDIIPPSWPPFTAPITPPQPADPAPLISGEQSKPLPVVSPAPAALPTAELPFLAWLKQGILTGHLEINDVQAKVHLVDDAVFLVSPEIFKLFVKESSGSTGEEWREVQKEFQKLKLHRRGKEGINIWHCEVKGPRKTRKVKGYILDNPALLFGDEAAIPESNPYLTLLEP